MKVPSFDLNDNYYISTTTTTPFAGCLHLANFRVLLLEALADFELW